MRRDAQFWAKAQRGIEANSETIAITRPKVVEAAAVVDEPALGPYVYRAAYVEYGTALARALTREDFEKARREYLKWLRDRGRYFFSELADAKAKAYVRRPSRMPAANGSDIGAADTGVIVQAEPAPDHREWLGFHVERHPVPYIAHTDRRRCARILDRSPKRRGRPPKQKVRKTEEVA
jgi:hypothetical protein